MMTNAAVLAARRAVGEHVYRLQPGACICGFAAPTMAEFSLHLDEVRIEAARPIIIAEALNTEECDATRHGEDGCVLALGHTGDHDWMYDPAVAATSRGGARKART